LFVLISFCRFVKNENDMENKMNPNRQNAVDLLDFFTLSKESLEHKIKYVSVMLATSEKMKEIDGITDSNKEDILFFQKHIEKTLAELKDKRRIELRDEIYKIQEQGFKAPDELLKEYAELSKNDIIINKLEG
jgi:hypothetical protein